MWCKVQVGDGRKNLKEAHARIFRPTFKLNRLKNQPAHLIISISALIFVEFRVLARWVALSFPETSKHNQFAVHSSQR